MTLLRVWWICYLCTVITSLVYSSMTTQFYMRPGVGDYDESENLNQYTCSNNSAPHTEKMKMIEQLLTLGWQTQCLRNMYNLQEIVKWLYIVNFNSFFKSLIAFVSHLPLSPLLLWILRINWLEHEFKLNILVSVMKSYS